jgi:catechol 2,3-dioxygenase-like lactoylglutathione lyase family enzyme
MGSSREAGDQRIEVVIISVADVERSRSFYVGIGWRLDATPPGVVQLTPPGSFTSVQFGPDLNPAAPGSSVGYLVVDDIVSARNAILAVGVEVSDYFHRAADGQFLPGLDPERRTYSTRARFVDPDGNTWILQEVTTRLPGRVEPAASYGSAEDLQAALSRAAAGYGQGPGVPAPEWIAWCADYLFAEANGEDLPRR